MLIVDKISVIVPCYNEEDVLPLFFQEVSHTLEEIENVDYEILFINDGSHDHSEDILKVIASKDKHCFYYSFSRNFGKEAAMYAGLENATGNYVVIMDADLQHPPHLLKPMYKALPKGDKGAIFRSERGRHKVGKTSRNMARPYGRRRKR